MFGGRARYCVCALHCCPAGMLEILVKNSPTGWPATARIYFVPRRGATVPWPLRHTPDDSLPNPPPTRLGVINLPGMPLVIRECNFPGLGLAAMPNPPAPPKYNGMRLIGQVKWSKKTPAGGKYKDHDLRPILRPRDATCSSTEIDVNTLNLVYKFNSTCFDSKL